MRVLKQKYSVGGKLYDDIWPELQDMKEGEVVQLVLVVEENGEEDKSRVKPDEDK